jgi:hypothetical protein
MFSPTVRHMLWNVGVEPVKCTPPRCGLVSAALPIVGPSPGRKLITPSGTPASRSSSITYQELNAEVEDGLSSTTLPMMAGAVHRLSVMAVKLNGATANTNPSSGR